MGSVRLAKQDYLCVAQEFDIELIGEPPHRTRNKALWRCKNGHEFTMRIDSVRAGHKCPYCVGKAPKTKTDYEALGKKRGYELVGDIPRSVKGKARWRCNAAHEFLMRYDGLVAGYNCPHCARRAKKTKSDYEALLFDRDIVLVGDVPKNVNHKTELKCKKCGYEWRSSYNRLYFFRGCPACAGVAKKTRDDYAALAKSKGFELIGDIPHNVMTNATWRCIEANHTFHASFHVAERDAYSCPKCQHVVNGSRTSYPQRQLHKMIGGELNCRVNQYAIDVALIVDDISIGVEYDCAYWHNAERDAKRDRFLQDRGWRILRIKSGELLPTREQLDAAIRELVNGAVYAEIVLADWRDAA